jgi:hypothetical protein
MDTLLTQREAAMALRLSTRTLERQRVSGLGVKFVKIGRAVRYRASDISEYVAARTVTSTSVVRR